MKKIFDKKKKKTPIEQAMSTLGSLGGTMNAKRNGKNRNERGQFVRKVKESAHMSPRINEYENI